MPWAADTEPLAAGPGGPLQGGQAEENEYAAGAWDSFGLFLTVLWAAVPEGASSSVAYGREKGRPRLANAARPSHGNPQHREPRGALRAGGGWSSQKQSSAKARKCLGDAGKCQSAEKLQVKVHVLQVAGMTAQRRGRVTQEKDLCLEAVASGTQPAAWRGRGRLWATSQGHAVAQGGRDPSALYNLGRSEITALKFKPVFARETSVAQEARNSHGDNLHAV